MPKPPRFQSETTRQRVIAVIMFILLALSLLAAALLSASRGAPERRRLSSGGPPPVEVSHVAVERESGAKRVALPPPARSRPIRQPGAGA